MLSAGAIVCIISIMKHMDTTYSLEILLAVLIVFYLIGTLARYIIEKTMVSNRVLKSVVPEEEEDSNESQDEDKEHTEKENTDNL